RRGRDGAAVAVDAHAVDVHDRRVALSDAVRAAKPNRAAGTGLTGVLHHRDARPAAGENVLSGLYRLDLERLHVDGRHRVADLLLPRLGGRPGDDDGVEGERGLGDGEVDRLGLTGADGDGSRDRREADALGAQLVS